MQTQIWGLSFMHIVHAHVVLMLLKVRGGESVIEE